MIRKECFLLNDFSVNNKPMNLTNKTLSFVPMISMPNIYLNISGFEYICGPLVMIVKEFAIKENIL